MAAGRIGWIGVGRKLSVGRAAVRLRPLWAWADTAWVKRGGECLHREVGQKGHIENSA